MPPDPLTHDPASDLSFNLFGLRLPCKATLAVIVTTLLLMVDTYYRLTGYFLPDQSYPDILRNKVIDRTLLYLIIPLLLIWLVFRESPRRYGFQIGDWRWGLGLTLAACLLAAPLIYFSARTPEMAAYYLPRYGGTTALEQAALIFLDLFGWEFVFRGLLLFALYRVAGPLAVVLQAVPFALGHIGKPALESLSTIFGGIAFGWVAWRTRSFFYPFLIHFFVLWLTVVVALGG